MGGPLHMHKKTMKPGNGNLVIRTGDSTTTTKGVRVIQKVDFPGSGNTDRRWEQPIMDAAGRLIVYVTFTTASGGGTSQILVP